MHGLRNRRLGVAKLGRVRRHVVLGAAMRLRERRTAKRGDGSDVGRSRPKKPGDRPLPFSSALPRTAPHGRDMGPQEKPTPLRRTSGQAKALKESWRRPRGPSHNRETGFGCPRGAAAFSVLCHDLSQAMVTWDMPSYRGSLSPEASGAAEPGPWLEGCFRLWVRSQSLTNFWISASAREESNCLTKSPRRSA